MPRSRSEFSSKVEKKILDLMARGGTAKSISKTLIAAGVKTSQATIGRRMAELRPAVDATRATRAREVMGATKKPKKKANAAAADGAAPPLPSSPEAIPEGTDLATFDRWLETADKMSRAAEQAFDLDGFGKMGRLTVGLLEGRRKAMPVPKPDPNDDPDMNALAAQVSARLHKLVDQVAGT